MIWVQVRRRRFWYATLVAPYIDIILNKGQFSLLSQIWCFGECKVVVSQILLDGAEPGDAEKSWLSSAVRQKGG